MHSTGSNLNNLLSTFLPNRLFYTLAALTLSLSANAAPEVKASIETLSLEFQVKSEVLLDFVSSYDFKCPDTITHEQLKALIKGEHEDNGLAAMVESDRLGWRDTYLEARSNISCLTEGIVSKGY
jgi:hypothetical protein